MKRYIRSNEVSIKADRYLVQVGGFDQFEVEADSEDEAIQIYLDTIAQPEDIEEYEDDPGYLWAFVPDDDEW